MEKHKTPPPPPRRRGAAAQVPSFSSTLLDAICRSMDDNDARPRRSGGAQNPSPPCSHGFGKPAAAVATRNNKKPVLRHNHDHRHLRRVFNTTTSSSSDCSSNEDFSFSDAEPVILRPIRTVAAGSIGRRASDLTPAKTPASPGARLASFINSLFTKTKSAESARACSMAKSYLGKTASSREKPAAEDGRKARVTADMPARSCLSKTRSSRERMQAGGDRKRTVRFDPASVIVDKDYQRRLPVMEAAEKRGIKGRVEEMRRRCEEGWESDSSSDLFELENLGGIGGGGEGKYRDELPVYKSTKLGRSGL